jgi:hypothetical protein
MQSLEILDRQMINCADAAAYQKYVENWDYSDVQILGDELYF